MQPCRVRTFSPEVETRSELLYENFKADHLQWTELLFPLDSLPSTRLEMLRDLFRLAAEFEAHAPLKKERFKKKHPIYRRIKFPFTFLIKKSAKHNEIELSIIPDVRPSYQGTYKDIKVIPRFHLKQDGTLKLVHSILGRSSISRGIIPEDVVSGINHMKRFLKSLPPEKQALFIEMPDIFHYLSKNKIPRVEMIQKKYAISWEESARIDGIPTGEKEYPPLFPLTIIDQFDITLRLLDQLVLMHEQGLLHRDVKRANIMLQNKNLGNIQAFLNDFDLTRQGFVGEPKIYYPYWDRLALEGVHTTHADVHGIVQSLMEGLLHRHLECDFFINEVWSNQYFNKILVARVRNLLQDYKYEWAASRLTIEDYPAYMKRVTRDIQKHSFLSAQFEGLKIELDAIKRIWDRFVCMQREEWLMIKSPMFKAIETDLRSKDPLKKADGWQRLKRLMKIYHHRSARELRTLIKKERERLATELEFYYTTFAEKFKELRFKGSARALFFGMPFISLPEERLFGVLINTENQFPKAPLFYKVSLAGYDKENRLLQFNFVGEWR